MINALIVIFKEICKKNEIELIHEAKIQRDTQILLERSSLVSGIFCRKLRGCTLSIIKNILKTKTHRFKIELKLMHSTSPT